MIRSCGRRTFGLLIGFLTCGAVFVHQGMHVITRGYLQCMIITLGVLQSAAGTLFRNTENWSCSSLSFSSFKCVKINSALEVEVLSHVNRFSIVFSSRICFLRC